MIDLERIAGFDWDAGNAREFGKQGVSQSESEQIFFDPRLLMVADPSHSALEPRYHALGQTIDGRHLHITFTLRHEGTKLRVISARDMHRKERTLYEQQT